MFRWHVSSVHIYLFSLYPNPVQIVGHFFHDLRISPWKKKQHHRYQKFQKHRENFKSKFRERKTLSNRFTVFLHYGQSIEIAQIGPWICSNVFRPNLWLVSTPVLTLCNKTVFSIISNLFVPFFGQFIRQDLSANGHFPWSFSYFYHFRITLYRFLLKYWISYGNVADSRWGSINPTYLLNGCWMVWVNSSGYEGIHIPYASKQTNSWKRSRWFRGWLRVDGSWGWVSSPGALAASCFLPRAEDLPLSRIRTPRVTISCLPVISPSP